MMKRILLALLLPIATYAGDVDFSGKLISQQMRTHPNAVVRDDNLEIDIRDPYDVRVKQHVAITILNEKGDKYVNRQEYFSQLDKIESIYGYIYDSAGKEIAKIRESDFKEYSEYTSYAAYSDNKVKTSNISYKKYPFTVEYFITTKQAHSFYLPNWSPQPGLDCSVEHATLTVSAAPGVTLRYKEMLTDSKPVISGEKEKEYKWLIANTPARMHEVLSYTGGSQTPLIMLAVNNVQVQGYSGSMETWKAYGKFIYELNKGRDVLPPESVANVKKIVEGMSDDHEKIKAVYNYLQNSTRYVAIEYGIGGWQTLDAGFLAKNQYGDCKALSNYMMAMLAAAGVISYPVVISAGTANDHKLVADFTSSQFNHEILCVPLPKDTVWLECTSSDNPANYLGSFTQDRDAVMITPDGGIIVHTPAYGADVNKTSRHGVITIADDGTAKVKLGATYIGDEAIALCSRLKQMDSHDRQIYTGSKFGIASYSVNEYNYRKIENRPVPAMSEDAVISSNMIITKSGARTFVLLDPIPLNVSSIPAGEGERKTAFHISGSRSVRDTFELDIPSTSTVEYIPDAIDESSKAGKFTFKITQHDNRLIMIRDFEVYSGVYDAADFAGYEKLLAKAAGNSNKKVVLKSKS